MAEVEVLDIGPPAVVGEAAPPGPRVAVALLCRAAEAVSRLLARLPEERRAVLVSMAEMGRRFERAALVYAATEPRARHGRAVVLGTLSDALSHGIIEAEPAFPDRYRFAHEAVRVVILEEARRPEGR